MWVPFLLMPALAFLLVPAAWPRWALMWTLAASIYAGCKWMTWQRTPAPGVPAWRHVAYLLAWPGLDAARFLTSHAKAVPASSEWAAALAKLTLGLVLFFGVARLAPSSFLAGWIGMVALVSILHFGIFHLLSCAWRAVGVDARPLMNRPFVSRSAGEFWGRRWNTAFRDLTHRFLFRPLTPALGVHGAIVAGFAFSGVVHDVVISVPARGGYGGPTLFFIVQAMAILTERSAFGSRLGLGRGVGGWLFTMAALAAPVYVLFHPPFVATIVVPFMRAVGAM